MTLQEQRFRELLDRYRDDPIAFVREEFGVEPDEWQKKGLAYFAKPETRRLAFKACKGPGKTALLAWFILNFLLTRPYAKVAATSITGDNLRDNLWAELGKWMRKSELLRSQFTWTSTRIVNKKYPAEWFAVARAWPKKADAQQQADTLAGLHGDFILFVIDEAGGIPQAVVTTAEAALATGIEMKVALAGNPTHTVGPLYRACSVDAKLWKVIEITGDPDRKDRSPRIDLQWAKDEIERWGRDNPWVKVNVLGEFPDASLNALLGVEEVRRAMRRRIEKARFQWMQKRLGVDVARYGDDRTVLFPRQGVAAFRPHTMRHDRGSEVSVLIAEAVETAATNWGTRHVFIDATGGWAAGARDIMVSHGWTPNEVQFGSKKTFDPRYANRRSEIWFRMAQAIKKNLALPPNEELVSELTAVTYTIDENGKFILQPKKLTKELLGVSPDLADALATTFGLPEAPPDETGGRVTKKGTRGRAVMSTDEEVLDAA